MPWSITRGSLQLHWVTKRQLRAEFVFNPKEINFPAIPLFSPVGSSQWNWREDTKIKADVALNFFLAAVSAQAEQKDSFYLIFSVSFYTRHQVTSQYIWFNIFAEGRLAPSLTPPITRPVRKFEVVAIPVFNSCCWWKLTITSEPLFLQMNSHIPQS